MITVAIVGRPNVGKSTLFNRFLRKRVAITDKISGTTRDRLYAEVDWHTNRFIVIDTGGVDLDTKDLLKKKILEQIKLSIAEADLIVFVTDVTTGIVPMDKEISRLLRQSGKDVVVAINKVDNERLASEVYQFSNLGWDRIVGISALHGLRVDKLLDMVPLSKEETVQSPLLRVAVIGRPNVGKSTFVNSVLDKPRMIVDERPGTTRDAVDIKFMRSGNPWLFIDTAGMRKRRKIKSPVEFYSVQRAYKSIDRADVVILMIDGWEGILRQEMQIVDYVIKKSKPCVIAVNKWDLVKITRREYRERITQRLGEHWYLPVVFISASKKENIDKLLDKAGELFSQLQGKVATGLLNRILVKLSVKVYYGTQVKTNPPTFLLFVNKIPARCEINYISNELHKALGLEVPISLQFRGKV